MTQKNPAILYHADCPDGFGSAYAAWKKFGENAEYIPVKHGQPAPEGLGGRDLVFIDFCYPKATMDDVAKTARSVTVLDHHEGVRDAATSFPGVFDTSHSGAVIAWRYFHPDTAVPALLQYVEDGDLYRFGMPHAREILAYVYFELFSFEGWEALEKELENPDTFTHALELGALYNKYHERLVEKGAHHAHLVEFEGYECYLVNAFGEFTSDIGNKLYTQKPPLALLVSVNAEGMKVSLRSDGSVNVAELAQKYGGNGHPGAAGFRLNFGDPIPWRPISKNDADSSH